MVRMAQCALLRVRVKKMLLNFFWAILGFLSFECSRQYLNYIRKLPPVPKVTGYSKKYFYCLIVLLATLSGFFACLLGKGEIPSFFTGVGFPALCLFCGKLVNRPISISNNKVTTNVEDMSFSARSDYSKISMMKSKTSRAFNDYCNGHTLFSQLLFKKT